MDNEGYLRFKGQIYIPPNDELRSLILNEAHRVVYMAHSGLMKMTTDLKTLILLERNEGRHSPLCGKMSRMLAGEG
jgi:hypothetical protein